jgi:hypothetical protein
MVYARQIVKNALGTQAIVKGFEYTNAGGLFNKVIKVNTSGGDFILKIECDEIFFATRKEQIENEVLGNAIFSKAGIPCAEIIAYDYTKNNVGARYVFMEHINNALEDWPLVGESMDKLDETAKSKIKQQVQTIVEKEQTIQNTHFGSLSPSGTLGRHETYDGYYHSTLNLLVKDSEKYGVFTDEELEIVKKAVKKPLAYSKKYTPTFDHGDLGYHNLIWGSTNGTEDKVYVIDFGNAHYWLPYATQIYGIREEGADIIASMGLDRILYENSLIGDFERMFWTVTQKLTKDYALCRFSGWTETVKADTSRGYITDFVDKCRKVLETTFPDTP